MKYYNIAVVVAGIDEEYQNIILSGIHEYSLSHNINIAHFVAFGGVLGNKYHDMGEFNIFSLPDYSKFDGFILLTNTISYPPVTNKIIENIRKTGLPAVSIDNDITDFMHIGIDNACAMKEITEHFILFHKFKRIKYISGPKDNPESNTRLSAFIQTMQEYGLYVDDDDIYYGDFRAQSGREAIKKFLLNADNLPEAIICANDVMAISAISALNASGYKVPEDISFSGFDNTYNARNYSPELTSVMRPLKKSGILACQKILYAIEKVSQERSDILEMQPRFTESCNCKDLMCDDISMFKKRNYNFLESNNISLSLINRMSCQLIECDSFEEYIGYLKTFIKEIHAEEFYLCLCDDWNKELDSVEFNLETDEKFTTEGYTENVLVPLAYYNGAFRDFPDFKSKQMLPSLLDDVGRNKFYYFLPMHFRKRCLGYCIILNSDFPMKSSMFQTWNVTISNTLENIRKIMYLDCAVKTLDKLYTVDTLSGILNRNGFIKNSEELYRYCIKRKKPVMLMFLDMDGLKFINDNFGHKEGDKAICSLAEVLRASCTNGEVYCRFGGDEFIIFAPDYNELNAEKLSNVIQDNIAAFNETHNMIFTLNASMGFHIAIPDENTNLFQLVTIADNIMYANKKRKKSSRYIKRDID